MLTVYGIKNCDTIKKSFAWLEENGIPYEFHDYKKSGIDEATLRRWIAELGLEIVLNKRGTTWKKLSEDQRADIDLDKAIPLMINQPSLIKRPIVQSKNGLHCGFSPEKWKTVFGKK